MTEQQAMRMALEALEYTGLKWPQVEKAHTALRQALEQQPADEPVAWMWYVNNGAGYVSRGIGFHQTDIPFAKHTPLYTRPQPAAWVGLTDEEIDDAVKSCNTTNTYKYFRAIEAKLKEKNT